MLKNIIFSGGGLKGWAYIGAIRALYELIDKNDIEHVIGVSIGSLFGLMYILQVDYNEILDYIMGLNYRDVLDIEIDNILINQSLLNGKIFKEKLCELIKLKIDHDITFKDLRKHTKILFTTCAINVSEGKLEYFNYLLTPDIKVIDALMASCSIPVLFPSYKIGESYYYDGGCSNNCPVNLVDELCSIAFDLGNSMGVVI